MTESTNSTSALIDHHLMMVGRLVNNGALCDAILFSAFKVISGCEQKVANAIYFSSETLQAKKNIITRILKVLGNDGETAIVNRIMDGTDTAQKQRNELSHALLHVSQDGQKILSHNPRRQSQAHKPVTGPYLDSLLKQSGRAHLDALLAFQELCQKRGVSPLINFE